MSEKATPAEIKSAYKSLAKAYHPDVNPSAEAEDRFKLISVAYSILTKPHLRGSHDSKLAAERLQQVQFTTRHYKENPYSGKTYQPPFRQRTTFVNPELEKKGTYYAFGMVAVIAIFFYIGIAIYDLYKERQLKEIISTFDYQVNHADSLFYAGKAQAALKFVGTIKKSNNSLFSKHEIDYLNFRKEQASIDYKNKAFQDALWGYLFYMEYSGTQDADMLFKLAICYRHIGQPGQSVFILDNLLNRNYKRVQTINLISKIYKEDLNDADLALQYYEIGLAHIEQRFKQIYGDAYRLLVSSDRTPASYKTLYFGAAELYQKKGNFRNSAKLLEWVIFFEPERKQAYHYLVESYLQLNDNKQACQIFNKAVKKGMFLQFEQLQNCM